MLHYDTKLLKMQLHIEVHKGLSYFLAMKSILFKKTENKDAQLTIRLKKSTLKKLQALAKDNEVSRTNIIEQLIETAFVETKRKSKNNHAQK